MFMNIHTCMHMHTNIHTQGHTHTLLLPVAASEKPFSYIINKFLLRITSKLLKFYAAV